jgi:hypothetical protein
MTPPRYFATQYIKVVLKARATRVIPARLLQRGERVLSTARTIGVALLIGVAAMVHQTRRLESAERELAALDAAAGE